MKRMFFISVVFWLCTVSIARTQPFERFHIYLGFGGGVPGSAAIGGTFFMPSGWGGAVYVSGWGTDSRNKPSDYSSGTSLFGNSSNDLPDDFTAWSFRVVKEFPTKSKSSRLGLELGPTFIKGNMHENFQPNPEPCMWGFCPPNYTHDMVSKSGAGVSFRAKIEAPVSVPFGLELGFNANINSVQHYFGADVMLNLGLVRAKK